MNIVVCMKQVPETTEVRIDPETKTLVREGVPSIVNAFDTYAIEEAIRLREKHGGTVTVMSMGPPQVKEALKEAIAMGCDQAVLLSDRAFAGSDTLATAFTLAAGIRNTGDFDIILCGKQAVDGDTAQVGPEVAENLDIPHVTYIRKIREINGNDIVLERMVEGGTEVIETTLPVLLTVVKEINEPRLPSLKGIMKAKRTEITVWTADDIGISDSDKIGLDGSPTEVLKVFSPEIRSKGEIFEGDVEEMVKALVSRLREAKVV